MRDSLTKTKPWLFLLFIIVQLTACTKKDIEFGNALGESYSDLVQVDTVSVHFATYAVDSFATNTSTDFIAGTYADSLLGTVKAKAYLQLMPELAQTLEDGALYDSLCFVIKLNQYSYGDTTKPQTISINELAEPLAYSYGTSIYNTSSFPERATALGTKTLTIYPHLTDSIMMRLSDAKGQELFTKMQQGAAEMQTADAFLAYFNGVAINFNTAPSAVYGFDRNSTSLYMRLYYHTSNPYPESKWKDFSYHTNLSSNQIIADRSGTGLASQVGKEMPSAATGNKAFTQSGTGLLLKMTYPTLKSVLQLDPTVKLLRATLVLKVRPQSYDAKTPLPSSLMLYQTDASNTIGAALYNAAGNAALTSSPSYDNIYDGITYYSFDLTNYMNNNLKTSGSESSGLFLVENIPGNSSKINRAAINDQTLNAASSQLILSLLTVKN